MRPGLDGRLPWRDMSVAQRGDWAGSEEARATFAAAAAAAAAWPGGGDDSAPPGRPLPRFFCSRALSRAFGAG